MIKLFYLTNIDRILIVTTTTGQRVMAMKEYSVFPRAPGPEPYHSDIRRTLGRVVSRSLFW